VAVKVLPEALAENRDRLSRFEQEARAASALNHPNIVTIHETGREGQTSDIAMELVDGRTLRELEASGPLPVRKMLGITAQVAEGLAKAHSAGIVHRDLKPENVSRRTGSSRSWTSGWRSWWSRSRAVRRRCRRWRSLRPNRVMGTAAYMSPEQASGEALDFRSDQFRWGRFCTSSRRGRPGPPVGRRRALETWVYSGSKFLSEIYIVEGLR
jgi:serine/threonine protein kinase